MSLYVNMNTKILQINYLSSFKIVTATTEPEPEPIDNQWTPTHTHAHIPAPVGESKQTQQ